MCVCVCVNVLTQLAIQIKSDMSSIPVVVIQYKDAQLSSTLFAI